jgi:hypothetical protein
MRYVGTDRLVAAVRRKLSKDTGAFTASEEDAVEEAIRAYMQRQPRMPQLISRKTAATILGVHTGHLDRLGDRLPKRVEIEGGRHAFIKTDITSLRDELNAEKQAKKETKL